MRGSIGCTLVTLAIGWPGQAFASPSDPPVATPPAPFKQVAGPYLAKYCTGCHGRERPKGGVDLGAFTDDASLLRGRKVWSRVKEQIETGAMPPEGKPRPADEESAKFLAWLGTTLAKVDCTGPVNPGRVTIRRLNRAEYNNTVRDLTGVDFHPADDFPSDDVGYGFDNIGDVLSLPPVLLERYLDAAETIAARAIEADLARPAGKRVILVKVPAGPDRGPAARDVVERFATRAFRRPVTTGEVARLLKFVDLASGNGETFERGVQLAVAATLVAPDFLFRVELDQRPPRGKAASPGQPDAVFISEFELASRLSYFLWSSMPDDELFRLAREGRLRSGDTLEKQVRRMLADPKSKALVENFGGQWLQTRNLRTVNPDSGRFPGFDEGLRSAMQTETELFLTSVLRDDRSLLDLIDADYTFVNERLARHYGIPGVTGSEFRRVTLKDGNRGGVLTQASILTVTSNPTRTSPVKRGKWILEQILGTPPPPPPAAVPPLADDRKGPLKGTLRMRMEQHRSNPACAACHSKMDPLGFGFENFDAVGAWRERDGDSAVDPSGVLPSGQTFKGPKELKAILKARKNDVTRCLAEKLLTYATGRGVEYYDACALDGIVDGTAKHGDRFSRLVLEVVRSDPFQKRQAKGGSR